VSVPGLQLERTQLAWTRTALGFILNAALVARFARDTHAAYALAAVLALTGALIIADARQRYAQRAADLRAGNRPLARPRALGALCVVTTLASLLAAGLVTFD
jgi:uncharacterized membrane protein YidH (DUF202 family)